MSFHVINKFEQRVAEFYGAPYAVAVDCCTHAIELCLRYKEVKSFSTPCRTYISVPFLAKKLNIDFHWRDEEWQDYYYLGNTNIIDAAVFWKKDGYISNTLMCLSFQYKKHLNVGRGGMILTDNPTAAKELKMMAYDGRVSDVPWREQNIISMGYHYYMTPETAQLGLSKIEEAINTQPIRWKVTDWPDLRKMGVFK